MCSATSEISFKLKLCCFNVDRAIEVFVTED